MDLCLICHVWPASCLVDITWTLFLLVMLIGTIEFYYFIPLLHKAKPVVFIFSHTFQLISMKFDWLLKQFKMNILILLSEIYLRFADCEKALILVCIWMFMNRFDLD